MMQEFFAESGHRVTAVHNGRDGLARALEGHYELVVLDVMLPSKSMALLYCISFRRHSEVPVIMLTARTHRRIESRAWIKARTITW